MSPDAGQAFCGDGQLNPNESCDRGLLNSNLPNADCRLDCKPRRCGDGVLDAGEQCDDGNTVDTDGCSNTCLLPAASGLTAVPAALHFGAAGVGCEAPKVQTLTIHNGRSFDVQVTKAALAGCSIQVFAPFLAATTLKPGDQLSLAVTFTAKTPGVESCLLQLTADDGTLQVPITAQASPKTTQIDRFEQRLTRAVDYVFLIDGGGSMMDEQQRLLSAAQLFVGELLKNKIDYHIAFVQLAPDALANEGRLEGTPPFLPTQQTALQLQQAFSKGFAIPGGWNEAGFAALLAALSPPRVAVLGTCAGCAAPNSCVAGRCHTPNAAFRRPGASLEVLAFTDEDDQSTQSVAETVGALRASVDPLLGRFARVHGLIPTASCAGGTLYPRWLGLFAATGGTAHDVCAANYGPAMKDLADRTFALLDRFFLTRTPVAGTIVVAVDGQPAVATYDAQANAVILTTRPPDGAKIQVSYAVTCN